MKQLKTYLIAATLIMGLNGTMQAQSKVAHIDTQALIEAMPETKAAKAELEQSAKTYDSEMQAMGTEYQNKVKQYQAEAPTKTDEENASRAQEVQSMEQSIRQFQAQAQQDLAKKEADLLKPIFEKAQAAITKVGTTLGYDYVLDSSSGQGVLLASGKDLFEDVKKELGF
jgi:outer membrane protein